MGQKANPKCLRLGITQNWDNIWYAEKDYANFCLQDFEVRNYLKRELQRAGVSKIELKRKPGKLQADIKIARPGIIFGKNNADTKYITDEIQKRFGCEINLNIIEEKKPDLSSRLLGEWVTLQLEKRIPFRRAMKMAVQKALRAGAYGVKIECAGRLGGVEIARREWYMEGKVPLHTFRANIDYSFSEALTTYGKIGVKVWLYLGEGIPQEFQKVDRSAKAE